MKDWMWMVVLVVVLLGGIGFLITDILWIVG